jgi:predicted HTH transcriptional regulator
MNKKKLSSLLKSTEGVKLDFKLQLDLNLETGKKELAKDVCAIANSRGGRGYLIIGVEDKTKKIVGVDIDSFNEEQVQQVISSRCEPPIPVSLEFVNYEGEFLAVITIFQSNQKPYQLRENGAFYIRRGSTTDTMRKQELITAFQESMNLNIELTPIVKSRLEHFDTELVDRYFEEHGIEVNDKNRITLMENTKIIYLDEEAKEYYGTLGGLLVFSKINYLYIPSNMIRIVNNVNENFDEIIIIQGDLLTMLHKSKEVLAEMLPESYPISAIHEGIKNALLYRDYTIINKEIEVILGNNSVNVISPGILLRDTQNKSTASHNYIRRNMWIYEKLMTLDGSKSVTQSGRGFSKMKKAFKNYGKVIFINSIKENIFKVIYPGINTAK